VPTFAEQGAPDIDVNSWWGIVGPAGLARPIVERLNAEIAAILGEPDMRATLGTWGIEASPGTPADFAALIRAEASSWRARVAQLGVKAQ
jgi:tripartite-type tricarboxylate transporter receptor subunit TctC